VDTRECDYRETLIEIGKGFPNPQVTPVLNLLKKKQPETEKKKFEATFTQKPANGRERFVQELAKEL
jgi:hypothetical protein